MRGAPLTPARLDRFTGAIAAAGFASGEVTVVGMWRSSPLGRLVDVMWIRPDGERVLLAPSPLARTFIEGLYAFDRAEGVDVRGGWDGRVVDVTAGPVHVRLVPAERDWRSWVFAARPRILRRSPAWLALENALVAPLGPLLLGGTAGVHLSGVTPGGRREWYSVDDYRPVAEGALTVGGRDAGTLTALRADIGVGLSAFPTRPALVHLATLIEP